jgi:hypothetical protein
MIIEGISYSRYRVTFTTREGKRRRWCRWAPGANFMAESIRRELDSRGIIPRGRVYVRWDGKS